MPDRNGMWGVRDTNAVELEPGTDKRKVRYHEVRPGKRYGLSADEETLMPEAEARIFLRDEAFIVTDAAGAVVAPLSRQQLMRTVPKDTLPPRMVIADLNELTTEALLTRAGIAPGGTVYDGDTPRQTLVDFLAGVQTSRASGGDGEPDDLSADEARRLLEGG